jgi:predicted RNA-binding protein YlxR (DUF448 family)
LVKASPFARAHRSVRRILSRRKGSRTLPKMRRKHVPLRSCIACRETVPKRELIRIVRTPEGTIEIDPKGKHPGRGAYLCRKPQCLDAAFQQRRLAQALRCPVSAEDVAALRLAISSLVEEPVVDSQTVLMQDVEAKG